MAGEQPEEAFEGMSLPDWLNFESRDRVSSIINALGAPGPLGTAKEERKSNNVMILPFGEAAPFTLTKRQGQVWALGSEVKGAKVTRIQAPMNAVSGVTFYSGEALTSPSVSVENGLTLFRNCTFIKQDGHADVAAVSIIDNGYAFFVGCLFLRDGGGAAPAIDNPFTAGRVKVVGCGKAGFGPWGLTEPPVASSP